MGNLLLFPDLFVASPQPPDAAARAEALEIRRSFIVEAPAGSGKTGLLIQRYLKLLADSSVTEPEQVLAITFTRKATAELRDRVLKHLESADMAAPLPDSARDFDRLTRSLASAVLARDRQFGWDLLDQPLRLNLRTIDSVCAEIARALPILSGSGGRLTPVEDAKPLFREAARRTLLLLGSGDAMFDSALRQLLLHRDGNLADCESLIADMLSLRDQWGDLIPLTPATLDDAYLDSTVLPRLQQALEQAVSAGLRQIADAIPQDFLADLCALAAELAQLDGWDGRPSPIAVCAGQTDPPRPSGEQLDHWRALSHLAMVKRGDKLRKRVVARQMGFLHSKEDAARLTALLNGVRDRHGVAEAFGRVHLLPPAIYPADQWAVAKSLFRVLSRALVELQLVFAERGECDFTELSLLARSALREESGMHDLSLALGARLQHLLVDEMQDTSTSQYELIQLLTQRWDGHSQTVFLVGDPRQSIYLFRQARVERFLATMQSERLGDLPLTRLHLTANFRSQRTLVDQFNADFVRIFPSGVAGLHDLAYTLAQSTLPASPAAARVWHADPLVAPPDSAANPAELRQQQAQAHALEARRIAIEWIEKRLPPDRTQPWKIAVLVRNRNHLADIVAAFNLTDERHGPIPYRAVEIEPLYERQEVLDLTALTRALLHPADRVAGLAVLHAPWCGLSLADLHMLTGADDPSLRSRSIERLIADRGHLLSDESGQRMQRVWTTLRSAATQRGRLSTAQLVERAWRSLGGDAWLDEAQLTNARRFFQLLDEIEVSGNGIDLGVLDDRMHHLYAEPPVFPTGQPVVELLTIHKAKGLEWDVVLVPALERVGRADDTRLLSWSELDPGEADTEDTAAHIMLAPIAGKGEQSHTLKSWLDRLHRAREAAERKRLFYVACTRAREELHLFAAPRLSVKGAVVGQQTSLLAAAWPAAAQYVLPSPAAAQVLDFGEWDESEESSETEIGDLAAAAEEQATGDQPESAQPLALPMLRRTPPGFDPAARFAAARGRRLPYAEAGGVSVAQAGALPFVRPEGSLAARAFGTAVHAFIEMLTARIAAGSSPESLLAELPAWTPRFAAILRAEGLPQSQVNQLSRDTRAALESMLRDPDGLWLLAPHPGARSEFALTVAGETEASLRVDRLFRCGGEPGSDGESHLWIVDYKTSTRGAERPDEFAARERATYSRQLEAYADALVRSENVRREVRLALYYPSLARLIWWTPGQPGG